MESGERLFREGTRPQASALVGGIDAHRDRFGIEPVCAVLECPAATYYAAKKRERQPSRREQRDEWLKGEIMRVWEDRKRGRRVYGARKVWLQLRREGITVARDFTAPAPNRRWVADITYVDTARGFVYTAFVTDLFSREIVGWQVADHLRAGLALDALEMAIFARKDQIGGELVHHSDRGVQYTSICYTQRLDDIGAVRSVGSKGDSYDNAAAEAVNSLYKKELINREGP